MTATTTTDRKDEPKARGPISPWEAHTAATADWLEKKQIEKNEREAEEKKKEIERLQKTHRSPAPGTAKMGKDAKTGAAIEKLTSAEYGSLMHHVPGQMSVEEDAAMKAVRSGGAETLQPLTGEGPALPPGAAVPPAAREPMFPTAGAWAMPLMEPPAENPSDPEVMKKIEARNEKEAKANK
jgi:hypothetical protein